MPLKLFFRIPEKIRFLLIGGANTVIGFFVFSALYMLFQEHIHYLLILILSNFIAVIFAFLMLKFLVFQTKKNYLKEFVRCYITYLGMLILNMILLYLCSDILIMPVIFSQFLITLLLVVISYLSHKHFSFKTTKD